MLDLLAVRDLESDLDTSESSADSRKLHKQTKSVSRSIGTSIFTRVGALPNVNSVESSSLELRLKLHIWKNLFLPFEVLVAVEQGKSVHHYLKILSLCCTTIGN